MNPLMNIQNVSLRFNGVSRLILDEINYTLFKGESVVILGGNGSGKSSLIRLINQSHPLSQGSIEFNQKPLTQWKASEFSRLVTTLAQNTAQSLFYDLTVLENCMLWETRFKSKKLGFCVGEERKYYKDYLRQFHEHLGLSLDTRVQCLSGGEKQALLLALCLQKPPLLLLLDEHTSALDPHQARHIMSCTHEMTKKLGITTIMTTHHLDHALEFGDRLIAIKEGKVIFKSDYEEKKQLTREHLLKLCY